MAFDEYAQLNMQWYLIFFGIWYLAFRHITTRASKQASEVYDQDRAVLDALK